MDNKNEILIFKKEKLFEFSKQCLLMQGMSDEDADVTANALVVTDMWGIFSHGTKNLLNYLKKNRAGGVSFNNRPVVISEKGATCLIDAKDTMGFVSANFGMNKACDLARENGIGFAVVKNSCHFGAAGCYSNIAAEKGMIGLVFSNVDPFMSIPGSKSAVMGQNPLSMAAPASFIPSVFTDMSTSNVASLRVINAKKNGEKIPNDWIIDKNGNPTSDPSHYPEEGALIPMGGNKGYSIALFVEILTSVLSGGASSIGKGIPSWNLKMEIPNGVSHSFVAINLDMFGGRQQFISRLEDIVNIIHSAPTTERTDSLLLPGERAWKEYFLAEKEGIHLPFMVMDELTKIKDYNGLDINMYGGGL